MKKILGIGGSPRKGGNSDILLKQLLKGARHKGVTTEEIQLRDYQFQPCIGCERCRKDKRCTGLQDGMQLIYPKIREAGGIVLISPIYSYTVTALMKAFIDRSYSFYNFSDERPGYWSSQLADQSRKAIIAVVGEQVTREEGGMDLTFETMRRSIRALGYEVVGELPVLGIFHKGKVKEYPQYLDEAEELGRRLASLL
ncbi:MAG: flavodoxin family protein [Dehalococcoidales bacterium]|jgi:multimeric flavodoxin WrbA|nr:flavodoxin family protein [Dehalococcoidales bacterium]MDP7109534.1 flavodoxin family protein [Dehalococcoidales bacterium]MDP7310411.1 flavodoxin family protein [Dehalococcoidales bacterium]HJM36421.1 flavodoxin family protein [Dehalococcoidales bacterium]|tara:strand:- start:591 stop:1184 length:594 start_codon:yes stop_codon:yes gene_type:complete